MPSLFRSFVAVLLGLMAILVVRAMVLLAVLHHFGTGANLARQAFLWIVLGFLLATFLGGLFTASLAGQRRLRHGLVLATVWFLLSAMQASHSPVFGAPAQQVFLLVGPPLAAVAGAFFAERMAQR